MSNLLFNIIYFVCNIVLTFIVFRFMEIFFTKIYRRKIAIVGYLSYFTFTAIAYLLVNIPFLTLSVNILCLLLITFAYESTIKRRIAAVLITYVFLGLMDIIAAVINLGHTGFQFVEKGSYQVAIAIVMQRLTGFFVAMLAQRLKNIKKYNPVSKVYWLSSFIIPTASIYLIFLIFQTAGISLFNAVLSLIALFAINILSFYMHDALAAAYNHKLEKLLYKQEKEYYYNQCELMQSSTDNLRLFRHEIRNHLTALNGLWEARDSDKVQAYFKTLIGEIESDVSCSNTGNIAFDSIINYKLRNALSDKIEVSTEIKIPQELEVNVADIVVILGNLLDNAINAVTQIKTGEKIIRLNISYSKGRLFIDIENSFNGVIVYEKDKIATTNPDKKSHGFGLDNVRGAVSRYNGDMKLSHSEGLFKVDVMLYL